MKMHISTRTAILSLFSLKTTEALDKYNKCSVFDKQCWADQQFSRKNTTTKALKTTRTNMFKQTRVVGGVKVDPKNYPFFVQLLSMPHGGLCGGSLISKNWILSAGHCFIPEESTRMIAIFNTNGYVTNFEEMGFDYHTISPKDIFIHEKYGTAKDFSNIFGIISSIIGLIPDNDIMLMRVLDGVHNVKQ